MSDPLITLSPSRIKRWVRCRKSYDWRYHQHLIRRRKELPPTLGLVVGTALATYYGSDPLIRDQSVMDKSLEQSSTFYQPTFLEGPHEPRRSSEWEKILKLSKALLSNYHEWISGKDSFEVESIEKAYTIELTPQIHLLAIPDAVVLQDESTLVFEHKVRYRYRPGDFGIDYQSVGSCLVSHSIGTLYNILVYSKPKLHRELIIRSDIELNYFRRMFIHIGGDILSSEPKDMYPMPFKRCSCEYWELCNGEMTGLDLDDLISELYLRQEKRPSETAMEPVVEEPPEE